MLNYLFFFCPFFLFEFKALFLGVYMFIIVMSSWWIDPFIIIICHSLSLLTLFKDFNLFDNSTMTLALWWLLFTWHIFFYHFTFNLFIFLNLKIAFSRQHMVFGEFLKSQSSILCIWLNCLIHSHLMLLLIWLNLHLTFCFLYASSFYFLHSSFTVFFWIKWIFSSVTFQLL